MEPQSGIRTWQWVVTVIVIIVLVIIGFMVFGGDDTEVTDTTDVTTTDDTTNQAGVNRVVMTDQYPGNVVYLSTVQVSDPSWVVIQADDNGKPGMVIGSAYFEEGINPGKITLTRPMIDGGTYYASIYDDASGATAFDIKVGKPVTDASGKDIIKVFKASSSVGAGLKG